MSDDAYRKRAIVEALLAARRLSEEVIRLTDRPVHAGTLCDLIPCHFADRLRVAMLRIEEADLPEMERR